MEALKHTLDLKPKKQVRQALLLVSTSIIIITSLLAYNRITYEFPLAVGNTGQSALGPPTSAGVGILYAMIVVDRKSTRLNSSHMSISYAVFCLKKKKK